MTRVHQSLVLSVFAVLAGCAESVEQAAAPASSAIQVVNTTCPIMGGELHAEELTPENIREFQGKKVGFCCPPCLEEWDALTDAQKTAALEKPPEKKAH